jgi:hypothetical protein
MLRQEAPFPTVLGGLVSALRYKAGWRFYLADLDRGQGSQGLTLVINITGPDSYHPEREISVNHYMLVPPAAYNERSWLWWLFNQILLVEQHEAMEHFRFFEDEVPWFVCPYAPLHGPGNDPYLIQVTSTDVERRTSFRGELNPDGQAGASDDAGPGGGG